MQNFKHTISFMVMRPIPLFKKIVTFYAKQKKVLCLGEGEGRNALFLADKGLKVEALDASDVALFKLRKRAKEHHLLIKFAIPF